jgi:ArsR family transcriptional regulator
VKKTGDHLPSEVSVGTICATYQALSDPVRVTILYLLNGHPFCVCGIKDCIGIAGSTLSYHLNIMKENGLIDCEQQGKWSIYQITDKGKKYAHEIE